MAVNTNTTESGAPTLSLSRCSRCVGSSNEACSRLSLTLNPYHRLHSLYHSCTFLGFPIKMFTQSLFCCQMKSAEKGLRGKTDNEEKLQTDASRGKKKRDLGSRAVESPQSLPCNFTCLWVTMVMPVMNEEGMGNLK